MKTIIAVAFALVAVAVAAPPPSESLDVAQILSSEYNQQPEGGYSYSVETSDGSSHQETGELKEVLNEEQKPQKVIVATGSYRYVDPLGNVVEIVYVADENGFQPKGDSIPTSPPVARR